jgi:hypothetical protein
MGSSMPESHLEFDLGNELVTAHVTISVRGAEDAKGLCLPLLDRPNGHGWAPEYTLHLTNVRHRNISANGQGCAV